LANAILDRLSQQSRLPKPRLAATTLTALCRYQFPGNIRELENILERAFTLCENGVIRADDLLLPDGEPILIRQPATGVDAEAAPMPPSAGHAEPRTLPCLEAPVVNDLEGYLENLEKAAIQRALEATRYNKTAAAEKLGITFRALRYRLKKLGLE
jgi:two-component system response regulator PilR (NtrC family)